MTEQELLVRKVLKLHDAWKAMHSRVKGRPRYFRYEVAPEWRGSSGRETFANWALQNGYDIGLVLDRRDNDKGYSPGN